MSAHSPARSNGAAPLPYDEAAEECLAGACLGSWAADAIEVASALVRPEYFYTPACRHVFETAVELHARGEAVDPHTVKHELERLGLLAAAGGVARLVELQVRGGVPSALPTYARLLAELAERRSLILAGAELQAAGRAGDRGRADKALEHLQAERADQGPGATMARALVRAAARRALIDGGSFIFDVTERPAPVWGDTGGIIAWSKGEYLLVTGPTGTGKSTVIQNVVLAGLGSATRS